MTLQEQLDQLMADHKLKTAREFDLLERLDSTLLHTDLQIEANIRRIVAAHEDRRNTVGELLNDLHHMMLGQRAYDKLPPIDDRYTAPIKAPYSSPASALLDEAEKAWQQVGMH